MKAVADGIRPNASARALLVEEETWHDLYAGSAVQLVDAGLARADMFPGQPGRGKVQCSYERSGQPATTAGRGRSRVDRLVIQRRGKEKFRLWWPVDETEGARRKAKAAHLNAEKAEPAPSDEASTKAHAELFVSLGTAFMTNHDASCARFNVGDKAVCCYDDDPGDGYAVEIVGAYGGYFTKDGGWQLGYAVFDHEDGTRCFAPAHKLLDQDGGVRHLRLVKAPEHRAPEYRGPERRRSPG